MSMKHIKYKCPCGHISWVIGMIPQCHVCGKVICADCRDGSFCTRCADMLTQAEYDEYENARAQSSSGANAGFACPCILYVIAGLMIMFAIFMNWGFSIVAGVLIVIGILIGVGSQKKLKKGEKTRKEWDAKVLPRLHAELGLPDTPGFVGIFP